MSSLTVMQYRGLPSADGVEVEGILKAKACFVKMSGSEELCFTAPVSLLSRLSTTFDALIQSDNEGTQTCVNLEVSDIAIFYRFFQFVYTGNYDGFAACEDVNLADDTGNKVPFRTGTSAKMVDGIEAWPVFYETSNTSGALIQSLGEKPSGGGLFGTSTRSAFRASTQSVSSGAGLFGSFTQCAPSGGGPFGASAQGQVQHGFKLPYSIISCMSALRMALHPSIPTQRKWKEQNNKLFDPRLSFKSHAMSTFLESHGPKHLWQVTAGNKRNLLGTVLGHAKIWRFAEKYAITALLDIASSQLTRELAGWVINDSTFIADFGNLVKHCYHGCSAGGNTLQLLIAQFAACIFEDFKDLQGWQELLGEVPAFRFDLGHALVEVYSTWQPNVFG